MSIEKPLLAAPLKDKSKLNFPLGATPKIDGLRVLKIQDDDTEGGSARVVSRTFKNIRNERIAAILNDVLPVGADGEVTSGETFQSSTSAVMTGVDSAKFDGQFTFYWFDYVARDPEDPYDQRMHDLAQYNAKRKAAKYPQLKLVKLLPKLVSNWDELDAFEHECLQAGYEGVMVRSLKGRYKFGRSTEKENILIKIKRFEDAEAEVIGFEELQHNENEAEEDAFGHTKRSSKQEHKVGGDMLGALVVQNEDGIQFRIGSGFTREQRQQLWDERDGLVGKMAKYRYFAVGVKTAPRFPTFISWRDPDDM